MTRAIVVCFHKYQPFGSEFYDPILTNFLQRMRKFEDEYDAIYILDSTWGVRNIQISGTKIRIIKVDPSLRYYDAYKFALPQVKEDLVFLMDNDTIIYKKGVIQRTFATLTYKPIDVVSIIDTIGTYTTDKLKNGNKFCPYFFATRKDLLLKYLNVEWGPNMPEHETLGKLTEVMLADGVRVREQEEDKSNFLIDGTKDGEKSKGLGYYHIRAGSTPAYLLAEKTYGNKETYWKYIREQPKTEYIRQCAWYMFLSGNPSVILADAGIPAYTFFDYFIDFRVYHGLIRYI